MHLRVHVDLCRARSLKSVTYTRHTSGIYVKRPFGFCMSSTKEISDVVALNASKNANAGAVLLSTQSPSNAITPCNDDWKVRPAPLSIAESD